MATDVQITGTDVTAKVRSPWAVLGLTLVTIGIYWIVWYFKINKELAAVGRARGTDEAGTDPVKSLLAVTVGALVIVPAVLSVFGTWKRLNAAERLVGLEPGMDAVPGFILTFFLGPIGTYFLQSNLNRVVRAHAA